MSTKAEKVKAQSLAAVGVHFNDYRRHLVGPNELESALEARQILKEIVSEIEHLEAIYSRCETDVLEDLIRRAEEVV